MSTTAPTEKPAEQTTPTAEKTESKRLIQYAVRRFVPEMDPNSALLPTDQWLKDTLRDIVKNNQPFRKTAGGILGYAALGLAAIAGGITAAVLLFPASIPMAAAGVAALGVAGFAAKKTHSLVGTFKSEVIPSLKETFGKKYLEFKANELKIAWQKRQAEYRAKKAAEKAEKEAKAAAERKAAEEARVKAEKEAAEKAAAQQAAAPAEKPAPEKAPEKQGGLRSFGKRMLQEAMKRAQEATAAPEKPAAEKPANENSAPQQTADKPKKDGTAPKAP